MSAPGRTGQAQGVDATPSPCPGPRSPARPGRSRARLARWPAAALPALLVLGMAGSGEGGGTTAGTGRVVEIVVTGQPTGR